MGRLTCPIAPKSCSAGQGRCLEGGPEARVSAGYLAGTDSWPVSAGIGFGKGALRDPGQATLFHPAKGLDPRIKPAPGAAFSFSWLQLWAGLPMQA